MRRVSGYDICLEEPGRGVGPSDDQVGLATVSEGFEDVGVSEQVALLVDKEGVAEEGVVVAARGGGLVEAVDDRADGGVRAWVVRRTIRGGQGKSAGKAGQ